MEFDAPLRRSVRKYTGPPGSNSSHDFKIYDEAGHAFFDDTRSSYVPSAAADAWTRTLAWFKKYLT